MNTMAAFGIAVGGTSVLCYLLVTRVENIRRNRRSPGDVSAADSVNYAAGDGWSLLNWGGGQDHGASDSSCNSGDFGGGDCGSGSGGDGGGGGGD